MKDGDGSLLDHSMILYGSNMSDSNRHNNDPLPSAAGSRYGRIKGGQHLRYPQDSPIANLCSRCSKSEIPVETIGDSTGSCRRSEGHDQSR